MVKKTILIITIILTFTSSEVGELTVGEAKVVEVEPVVIVRDDWDVMIDALIQVESEGNPFAIGKTNDVGILQITPIYVREVNRILQKDTYDLTHRTDIDKSIEMFEIYQAYHNPSQNIEKAIRLHNPGAGQSYLNKVMNEFNKIKLLT